MDYTVSKSSSVEDDEVVYKKLEKFVYYLAWSNNTPGNVMMEAEEISAELFLELAKGLKYYKGYPQGRKLAAIRRMLDNRVSELKYRYFGTHRKAAKLSISIETDESCEMYGDSELDPERKAIANDRVLEVRSKLVTEAAKKIFDTIILGTDASTPRFEDVMLLNSQRATMAFKNPTLTIKTSHIADALFMTTCQVRTAMDEIKKAYDEVYNG